EDPRQEGDLLHVPSRPRDAGGDAANNAHAGAAVKVERGEEKEKSRRFGRRHLLKGAAVAGIAAASPSTAQAPAESDAITAADLAVADKIAGRSYTDAERTLMTRTLGRIRTGLKAIRAADLAETIEPGA